MCGITGILHLDGAPIGVSSLKRAMDSFLYRGPDDSGIYKSSRASVVLGHQRLSILDLSKAGRQPMVGCRPGLILTYNGEIYNYKALRRELESHGYQFKSQTDTEVLLHAIDLWGPTEVPRRLNGIFAYACLDEDAGTLTLARDQYGVKPLYYYRNSKVFLFASEIKGITSTGLYTPEVLLEAVPEYLTFRSVAGERTLFRDIVELAPGSVLTVDLVKVRYQRSRFAQISVKPKNCNSRDALRELSEKMTSAVSLQLQSDVLVGSLNSGGLDSSLVSALAVANGENSLRTYCASYGGAEDGQFDESHYASLLSEHLGTRHRDIATKPDEFFSSLEYACWLNDEPLAHPNSIPLFKVFKEARADGVKVMLSGEGADELFGGYDFFTDLVFLAHLSRFPFSLLPRRLLLSAQRISRNSRWSKLTMDWARKGAEAVADIVAVEQRADLRPEERLGPYRQKFLDRFDGDLFAGGSEYIQRVYLPPILQRCDRMSMASGVECRVPYLDNHITQLANKLPYSLKRRIFPQRRGKILLKNVASSVLPEPIITRAKYGFAVPLSPWFRSPNAGLDTLSLLHEPLSRSRPWVTGRALIQLLEEHQKGLHDHSRRLWTHLTLELWARQFIDGASTCADKQQIHAEYQPGLGQ
jgi:asparagine synthase (glutamine-hydrolysing)